MRTYLMLLDLTRTALLWLAVALSMVCLVDWLVRTRRINPFSPVARFFRRVIDPLMAPVERRVVRAGGLPSSAPWWALGVVVVGGILLIQLLGFFGAIVQELQTALAFPSMLPRLLGSWTFALLRVALIVRVLSTWLPVSPYSPWIRWSYVLTEWFLGPIRRVLPTFGPIDLSPLAAYFLLGLVQNLFRLR